MLAPRKFYSYKEEIDQIVDRKILNYTNNPMTMKQIVDELGELDHMATDLDIRAPHFFNLKWNTEIRKYIDFKCNILRNILFAQKVKIDDIIESGELRAFTNIGFSYKAIENYFICWRNCVVLVLEEIKNCGCKSTIDIYNKFADEPLKYCFSKEIGVSIKNNADKFKENNFDDFIKQLKDGFKNYVNDNAERIVELADKVYNANVTAFEIY